MQNEKLPHAVPPQTAAEAVSPTHRPSIFSSFWMAGFESACHVNRRGQRLDMMAATQHDRFAEDDYSRLRQMGISAVRDTVRWHLIERTPGTYDFSSVAAMAAAAEKQQVQVIWDLCHYGLPDDLDIFSPAFIDRFASFARATTRYFRERGDHVPFYTPINEISFFSWAAGEVGWFHPFAQDRGGEVKRQLIRAWIAAVEAIWDVDRRARIVSVEPLVNVIPPAGKPDIAGAAAAYHNSQFEAWDMLTGAIEPQLGGKPKYLDIIASNFYHDNQWEHPGGRKVAWHIKPRDPRWVPFHQLFKGAYERYRRPILIGETSHVGSGRAEWLREMASEIELAIAAGVPIEGVCLYPIIDRFEWDNPNHWHNSGLWDFTTDDAGNFVRVLNDEYAAELWHSQVRLASRGYGAHPPFALD